MKKSDLIAKLVRKLEQYSDIDILLSSETIQEAIINTLKERQRVEIRGFGTFCIRDRKSIRARNPKSGETIELPKRSIPYFRASKILKQRIN